MAIYAQRTAFRSSAQAPDFSIITEPQSGEILIYDPQYRAFVNKSVNCIVPTILSAINVEVGSGIVGAVNLGEGLEVFKTLNVNNELEFRTIIGGEGVTVTQDANEITIFNNIITESRIEAPDSFALVIDGDDSSLNLAKFEIFTVDNPADITLTPTTYNAPNLDIEIVTDPTFTNPGQIKTQTADFVSLGFEPGMAIKLSGTTEQDGIWIIDTVTSDTITITVPFTDASDAGLQPACTLEALFFEIVDNNTLKIANHNLVDDGFAVGQTFTLSGTTDNDGTYTVASVSGDTLDIVESFPGSIGHDVSTISLVVPAEELSTGWWVNELGEMNAKNTNIDGNLNVNGDVTIDGTFMLNGLSINNMIDVALPVFPETGLIVQTADDVFVGREIEAGAGIVVTNGDGIAGNPQIAARSFDLQLTGAIQGSATINGLQNTIITTTLANVGTPGTYNRVTVDEKGRVILGVDVPMDFQPSNVNLDNLADGLTNPGYVVWDGVNYIERSIAGVTDQIVIVNDSASLGNTEIGIAENPILPGTGAATLPRGTDAERPLAPINGAIRYNTEQNYFEGYVNGSWERFAAGTLIDDYLSTSGGTMSGDIIMGDNNITFTTGLVDGRDVSADGAILDTINTGTGFKVQTGANTFENRIIEAEDGSGIVITNGDGVSGNPIISYDIMEIPVLDPLEYVDEDNDYFLMHDTSSGELRRVTPRQINRKDAFRYFVVQF